jgi:hypothetical protein
MYICKDRFFKRRRSMLMPRGDGSFQILERNNNNTYKANLPCEYGVNILLLMFLISLCFVEVTI